MSEILIAPDALTAVVAAILRAAGSNEREAGLVAGNLVGANLAGHDSHGIGMLPRYIDIALAGDLPPNQHARIELDTGPLLRVNGNGGYGQVVGLENEDPFSLWGMVVRQFRLLIQAREILDGRGNKDDVARALGVHPFVAEKTTGQAARFSMESLESIYHRLLNIDERVKTSQITLDLALDTLVVELAR